jgi:hypothetical protein
MQGETINHHILNDKEVAGYRLCTNIYGVFKAVLALGAIGFAAYSSTTGSVYALFALTVIAFALYVWFFKQSPADKLTPLSERETAALLILLDDVPELKSVYESALAKGLLLRGRDHLYALRYRKQIGEYTFSQPNTH